MTSEFEQRVIAILERWVEANERVAEAWEARNRMEEPVIAARLAEHEEEMARHEQVRQINELNLSELHRRAQVILDAVKLGASE